MTDLRDIDFLKILFARLHWPTPLVRLRAAQEIAGLIEAENTRKPTVKMFMDRIGATELESEAAALLQIIAHWELYPYFDQIEIGTTIQAHSILTFSILNVWPGGVTAGLNISGCHSGLAPAGYEPSSTFLHHSQSATAPVFSSELKKLEMESGFPVYSQWAYEWEQLQSRCKFVFCASITYFLAPDWQSRQAWPDVRQQEIYLSAYLRTLACAVDEWHMPLDRADFVCSFFNRTNRPLVAIEPSHTPNLFQELEDLAASKTCAELAGCFDVTFFPAEDKFLLSDFTAPIQLNKGDRLLNVCARSFLGRITNIAADESEIQEHLDHAWALTVRDPSWEEALLDTEELKRYVVTSSLGELLPICLSANPIHRGRWFHDYFVTEFKFPASYIFLDQQLSIHRDGKGLQIQVNGETAARWLTWNRGWQQAHIKGGSPCIGSATHVRESNISNLMETNDLELVHIITVEEWSREHSYGDYRYSKVYRILPHPINNGS